MPQIDVIGAGGWGKNWVRVLHELGVLHMVCDCDSDTLLSAVPHDVMRTTRIEDVQKSEADGVIVATPASTHYGIASRLMMCGKDVLVEKPMALNVTHGQSLVGIARDTQRILMVGHVLEYHPAVVKLKHMVDVGAIGQLYYIYSNRLNMGKVRAEENILWSFAPHDISVILSLLGNKMPVKVCSHGGQYLKSGIADVTTTSLTFPNGVQAHIFVSWLHPYKSQEMVVVGSKGMLVFNDTRQFDKLRLYEHELRDGQPKVSRESIIPYPDDEPLKQEAKEFLRCIDSRGNPLVDGKKGLQVLQVLERCGK